MRDLTPAPTRLPRRQLLGAASALFLGSGCGYLLYPERKGRNGGYIDTGPFIIDLLWLLPGLIPGIICLIVDFSTGCIYRGGGGAQNDKDPRDPSEPMPIAKVMLDGKVVGQSGVDPEDATRIRMYWSTDVDREAVKARGELVFLRHDAVQASGRVIELA